MTSVPLRRLRVVPRRSCCDLGSLVAPGRCPEHDAWRTPIFLAPDTPDDQEHEA